jgi:hypothetical protein
MASLEVMTDLVHMTVIWAAPHFEEAGVRGICRSADDGDWQAVARSLASAHLADPVQRACVAAVLGDVWYHDRMGWRGHDEAPLIRFLAAAFGPRVETVADVAARLGVDAATLEAWFARCGLPGADCYVAGARLVRAAWAGEPPTADTLAAAVWHPDPAAPTRFHRAGRRLRRLAAIAALGAEGAAPHRLTGTVMLNSYRMALVRPFSDALRTFDLARVTAP